MVNLGKKLVGYDMGEKTKDHADCSTFYGLFIAPKMKHCLTNFG